jgi:hypothetical protein
MNSVALLGVPWDEPVAELPVLLVSCGRVDPSSRGLAPKSDRTERDPLEPCLDRRPRSAAHAVDPRAVGPVGLVEQVLDARPQTHRPRVP